MGNVSIVVIRRPVVEDRYGDKVPGTERPVRIVVRGCAVSPRSSTELSGPGRAGVLIGLDVLAPKGADVRRSDQVEISGELFDVEGDIGSWRSPYSRLGGVQFALRRAVG